MASVVAGAVAAVLLCPMESTRIRIVTDKEYANKGLFTGLPKLIKDEGLLSTFSGLWAMLAKQVRAVDAFPYTPCQLESQPIDCMHPFCRSPIHSGSKCHLMSLQDFFMPSSTNTATALFG
jgi:Mitochondrial carrier protein